MSTTVAASLIVAGNNDRKTFDPDALNQLADSITVNGLLENPVVRPLPNGMFEIVAGERRFRAMTEILGWVDISVVIREFDDAAAAQAMLAENFHRVDLNPIEEGAAYAKWAAQFGWTIAEIARRAHTQEYRVSSRLKLLDLIDDAQHLVAIGSLRITYAAKLVGLDGNRQRIALREWANNPTIKGAAFARICNQLLKEQNEQPLFELATEEYDSSAVKAAAVAPKPVGLATRLAVALRDLDPGHPLLVEAAGLLAA